MATADAATVVVVVAAPPELAFQVFTDEVDSWWRTGPRFRIGRRSVGRLAFEGGLGGRLFETYETAAGSRTHEAGRITQWEPPWRLSFEWRGVNFRAGESTLVEISFEPSGDGTRVTLRHSGWSSLPDDHPVRHGKLGAEFIREIGLWWGALLSALREHVQTRE
ncbi:MAG: SRPBCC domain-containing protein [Polyangiaceae bacterium]